MKNLLIALALLHLTACTTSPRTPASAADLQKRDFELFSWCLDEGCQKGKFDDPKIRAYGRDLDFVLRNCGPNQLIGKARATGKKVVCYMSLGSIDKDRTEADSYERNYDGVKICGQMERYPKEFWIDYSPAHRSDSMRRLKEVVRQAADCCDAMEYDNTDAYEFHEKVMRGRRMRGDCTSKADMLAVLNDVCLYARSLGMKSILKNGFEIAPEVADAGCFGGAITEACDQTQADNGHLNCSKLDKLCRVQDLPCVNISYRDEGGKRDCAVTKKFGFSESYLEGSSTSVSDNGVDHCSQKPGWWNRY